MIVEIEVIPGRVIIVVEVFLGREAIFVEEIIRHTLIEEVVDSVEIIAEKGAAATREGDDNQ